MSDSLEQGGPILVFDGVCNICAFGVGVVLRRDREGVFRFAFGQGAVGRSLKQRHGLDPDNLQDVTLIEGGRAYTKSTAALRVLDRLPAGPWKALRILWLLPPFLRDPLYMLVARNRYRLFGRKKACFLPPPEAMARFLDKP